MKIEIRSQGRGGTRLRDLVTQWLVNALGLLLVSKAVKGIELSGDGLETALTLACASAVLGLLNLLLKPLLILVTLPITVLTLGLFLVVINALVLMATSALVAGFEVDGFLSALAGSLLLSLLTLVLGAAFGGGSVSMSRRQ